MTQRGSQTIKYDPQRRPVRLDSGGTTVWRTAYDGDGVRRKRLDQTGTIHYLGAYERNVGNGLDTTEVVTKHYAALGRMVAFRKNGTLYWVGTDHLGSTIQVANASFASVDGMRYTPYGVSRDAGSALNTDHRFTSQIEDASIGLYWYNSRAYDQALGRFVAPDPIVPELGNPQALNRYAYASNNPLRFTDPTGHATFAEWVADFKGTYNREPTQHEIDDWNLARLGWSAEERDDYLNTPQRFSGEFDWMVRLVREGVMNGLPQLGVEAALQFIGQLPGSPATNPPSQMPMWWWVTYGGVIVWNNLRDDRADIVRRFEAAAIVWESDQIWSTGFIEPDSPLLAHELGHVVQMRLMGRTRYIATYVMNVALALGQWQHNEMERNANDRAHLPLEWRPGASVPVGWVFRAPDGLLGL